MYVCTYVCMYGLCCILTDLQGQFTVLGQQLFQLQEYNSSTAKEVMYVCIPTYVRISNFYVYVCIKM